MFRSKFLNPTAMFLGKLKIKLIHFELPDAPTLASAEKYRDYLTIAKSFLLKKMPQ